VAPHIVAADIPTRSTLRLFILYGHDFGEKVIGNMVNLPDFCRACDLACTSCRIKYSCFAPDVCGAFRVPNELPDLIDDPETYLPNVLPRVDLLLAIGLHPDLLAALPSLAASADARAIIAPIEDPKWCPPSLRMELQNSFDNKGIETAFPRPFCDLDATGGGMVEAFARRYQIGKPVIEMSLLGSRISETRVIRSAPCGSTWYVAQQIRWSAADDMEHLKEVVSNAHHGYPCTASMEIDPELKDTILHRSGYVIRDAVEDALMKAKTRASAAVLATAH
jgi:hypothetical protein